VAVRSLTRDKRQDRHGDGKRYCVSKHHLTLVRRGYVHPQSADGEEQDQAEFEHSRIIGAQSNSFLGFRKMPRLSSVDRICGGFDVYF